MGVVRFFEHCNFIRCCCLLANSPMWMSFSDTYRNDSPQDRPNLLIIFRSIGRPVGIYILTALKA